MKKLLEQKSIDDGQIGKFLIVFQASQFPVTFLTFIMSFGSIYELKLYEYMNLYEYALVFAVGEALWLLINWRYIYPSISKGNYELSMPLKEQLDRIEFKLNSVEGKNNER